MTIVARLWQGGLTAPTASRPKPESSLQAGDTSFNINFLHGARPVDLVAEGAILRLGKRLAVIEVRVHSASHPELVAHATGTYSIPPGTK